MDSARQAGNFEHATGSGKDFYSILAIRDRPLTAYQL